MLARYFIIPSFTWAFPATLCCIAGIFCSTTFLTPVWWASLGFINVAGGLFLFLKNHTRLLGWWFFINAFFMIGVFRTLYARTHYEFHQKELLRTKKPLTLRLIDHECAAESRYPYVYYFSLHSSSFLSYAFEPFCIKIYTQKPLEINLGDILAIKNLCCPSRYKKEYQQYLLKEGILATVFVEHLDYTAINTSAALKDYWTKLKNETIEHLKTSMHPQAFALFSPIFLGNKSMVDPTFYRTIKQDFKYWGIMHYLARSGLHVVLVIAIYLLLLKMLPCSFFFKKALLGIFLLFYTLLSWSSVSFLRALITYFITQLCLFNWVWPSLIHSVCLTCLLTLLYNPFHLFFLDFQLSFFLTFCLSLFISNFKKTIV